MVLGLVEPPVTAQAWDGIRELVENHREQAEEGHERLRRDYRALESRVERIERDNATTGRRVDRLENTPPNIEKMSWSTRQLMAIVASALVLAGGMWQLHDDMKAATKLQDERYTVQMKQMDDLGKELQLRRLEIKDLSKQMSDFQLQQQQRKP